MTILRLVPILVLALVPAGAYSPAGVARSAPDCSVRQTGLIPLTDMGRLRYRGQPGGLYRGGANRPGRRFLERGLRAAARVRPIRGRIGFVGIGMSSAMDEFRGFSRSARQLPDVNPALTFVEGPGGGWDAVRIARPGARYWRDLDVRIRRAQIQRRQVQVAWVKQAIAGEDRAFPQDARALRANLRAIVRIMTRRFPNLQLVFVSSRTYGGYAITHLNPEPYAYDSGFAVKWLVQDSIARRLGRAWVGWGPYLWTDGLAGRRDGLTWTCDDVLADGTHPSASGIRKVARLLTEFFSTDPMTRQWFTPSA